MAATKTGTRHRSIPACAGNTAISRRSRPSATVHPRMRGEHLGVMDTNTCVGGPSPHARGTLEARKLSLPVYRSIPACAGNTLAASRRPPIAPVHPRMRGEHAFARPQQRNQGGPSPHARGTHSSRSRRRGRHRSIPACAGNTSSLCASIAESTVHPRMRGEHFQRGQAVECHYGPSPHARGTRSSVQDAAWGWRSIPACAGNTATGPGRSCPGAVHPRMRGEHERPGRLFQHEGGPSPHARGTPHPRTGRHPQRRSIPACAGNTLPAGSARRRSSVHPRMRGEHARLCPQPDQRSGPSPHARGTHWMAKEGSRKFGGPSPHARGTLAGQRADLAAHRSIPACAGNTLRWSSSRSPLPVHPRMRGEHGLVSCDESSWRGPSPHARGTQDIDNAAHKCTRSIPACAGNTELELRSAQGGPVHPRMRGEHAFFGAHFFAPPGPSPHARGTRWQRCGISTRSRSIPACAGNTAASVARTASTSGPSPHARGTLEGRTRGSCRGRSIPACAGNTVARLASGVPAAVHPRMRGDHLQPRTPVEYATGPSPHARGTRVLIAQPPALPRSIPACAGNTCSRGRRWNTRPVHPRMRGEHAS